MGGEVKFCTPKMALRPRNGGRAVCGLHERARRQRLRSQAESTDVGLLSNDGADTMTAGSQLEPETLPLDASSSGGATRSRRFAMLNEPQTRVGPVQLRQTANASNAIGLTTDEVASRWHGSRKLPPIQNENGVVELMHAKCYGPQNEGQGEAAGDGERSSGDIRISPGSQVDNRSPIGMERWMHRRDGDRDNGESGGNGIWVDHLDNGGLYGSKAGESGDQADNGQFQGAGDDSGTSRRPFAEQILGQFRSIFTALVQLVMIAGAFHPQHSSRNSLDTPVAAEGRITDNGERRSRQGGAQGIPRQSSTHRVFETECGFDDTSQSEGVQDRTGRQGVAPASSQDLSKDTAISGDEVANGPGCAVELAITLEYLRKRMRAIHYPFLTSLAIIFGVAGIASVEDTFAWVATRLAVHPEIISVVRTIDDPVELDRWIENNVRCRNPVASAGLQPGKGKRIRRASDEHEDEEFQARRYKTRRLTVDVHDEVPGESPAEHGGSQPNGFQSHGDANRPGSRLETGNGNSAIPTDCAPVSEEPLAQHGGSEANDFQCHRDANRPAFQLETDFCNSAIPADRTSAGIHDEDPEERQAHQCGGQANNIPCHGDTNFLETEIWNSAIPADRVPAGIHVEVPEERLAQQGGSQANDFQCYRDANRPASLLETENGNPPIPSDRAPARKRKRSAGECRRGLRTLGSPAKRKKSASAILQPVQNRGLVACDGLQEALAAHPEGRLVVQRRSCRGINFTFSNKFDPEYDECYCRACKARNGNDACRFRNLRVLLLDGTHLININAVYASEEDDKLSYNPHFWDGTLSRIPLDVARNYIRKFTSPTVVAVMHEEYKHANRLGGRRVKTPGRQLCDSCNTTLFNSFWMCAVCGSEVCLPCHTAATHDTSAAQCLYSRQSAHKSQYVRMNNFRVADLTWVCRESTIAAAVARFSPPAIQSSYWTRLAKVLPPPVGHGQQPYEAPLLVQHADNVNIEEFQEVWRSGTPVVIEGIKVSKDWTGHDFVRKYGKDVVTVVNCRDFSEGEILVRDFFLGFKDPCHRPRDAQGKKLILKLKDWPTDQHFKDKFPDHFEDFMNALPYPEYTRPNGHLNLVSYLPKDFSPPDLGPKMYNAYAAQKLDNTVRRGSVGTTCLHLDMADAVNLMVYVGPDGEVDDRGDGGGNAPIGAVWDIFPADKLHILREFLHKEVRGTAANKTQEPATHLNRNVGSGSGSGMGARTPGRGLKKENGHAADIIHDQVVYLTDSERRVLHEKYGVRGWRVYQKQGDAVYVPAGCAHQVANIRSAVKVAMDFVSPEHVDRALAMTEEFRLLPPKHRRRVDLLQLKNILWATWMAMKEEQDLG